MKLTLKKILALAIAAVMVLGLFVTSFAVLKGDIDKNGEINSTDALIALKCSVGSYSGEVDMRIADMDGNGEINSTDALKILRISVGTDEPEELPEDPTEPTDPTDPTEPTDPIVPSTTKEIVAAYNNAVNKVISEKAGYKKARKTDIIEMNGGALLKIQLVKDMINEFLGVGTTEYINKKGEADYLSNASLSVADLNGATCVLKDGKFEITLSLKDGKSSANKSRVSDTSALAKSGLLTGKKADPTYDYLSSEGIYKTVSTVDPNVSVESVSATNSNIKFVAVVDAATGNMVSLSVSYDWTVAMKKVKYTVVSVNAADGKASTKVELSDFEW